MLKAGGLAALLVAALMAAPVASADDDDDICLAVLAWGGIHSSTDPAGLITMGHAVCNAFDHGRSAATIAAVIVDSAEEAGIPALETYSGAGTLVGAAVGAYCPQYQSQVHI